RFEPVCGGAQDNPSRVRRRADDDAVDAVLDRQALRKNVVVRALRNAAAPFPRTGQRKVDQVKSSRPAPPFAVHDLDIDDCKIRTVSAQALRGAVHRQTHSGSGTCRLLQGLGDLSSVPVIAYGPECACLRLDIFEGEKKPAAWFALAHRLAV